MLAKANESVLLLHDSILKLAMHAVFQSSTFLCAQHLNRLQGTHCQKHPPSLLVLMHTEELSTTGVLQC